MSEKYTIYTKDKGVTFSVRLTLQINNVKFFWLNVKWTSQNKEERYSRGSRLLDTRYLANRSKREMEMYSSETRLYSATYTRFQHMVMWAVNILGLWQSICIDEIYIFQLKEFLSLTLYVTH